MTHEEWLKWRSEGIGSSDAPVIMLTFPFGKTPYMLWEEKILKTVKASTAAMEHGKKYEAEALAWFEEKTGIIMMPQAEITDQEFPWMRATLDGINITKDAIIEIKCPYSPKSHMETKRTRQVPDIYIPQCQHQMRVADVKKMYFLSYATFDPSDSVLLEIERDDKYIAQLIEKEKEFWDCVQNHIEPPKTKYDSKNREGHPDWKRVEPRLKEAIAMRDRWTEEVDELKRQLISTCDDMSAFGYDIHLSKSVRGGRIDYERAFEDYLANMRAHYPDVQFPAIAFDPYRKESFTKWTLRVKKET
jgi:putative phage-type endonuclease